MLAAAPLDLGATSDFAGSAGSRGLLILMEKVLKALGAFFR